MVKHSSLDREYGYDYTQSYRYPFHEMTDERVAFETTGNSFLTPPGLDVFDTALLNVELSGSGRDPLVVLTANETRVEHGFENKASGHRFLNVSALLELEPGTRIRVSTSNTTVKLVAEEGLIGFTNPRVSGQRVLIVAPHPDDAEIAAFGLYSRPDVEAYVVTVTAGDAGYNRLRRLYKKDRTTSFATLGRLRVINSITAPMIGGVPPHHAWNLGYFDRTLAEMHRVAPDGPVRAIRTSQRDTRPFREMNVAPMPPTNGHASWQNLLQDLVWLFDRVQPEMVVAPHPQFDLLPDHQYTALAVLEAVEAADLSKGNLLFYTNHPLTEHAPFGPAGSAYSLPPWFGSDLGIQSILSLPTDGDQQRLKLLALESSYDLRSVNRTLKIVDGLEGTTEMLRRHWREIKWHFTDKPARGYGRSYFRRAIRDNELFFVMPYTGVAKLAEQFTQSIKPEEIQDHRTP